MTPVDFARTFLLKPFDLGFEEGAELVDPFDNIWVASKVDRHCWQATLIGTLGTKTVAFNTLIKEFRVLHRRSVYARLLAEDDPFKDIAAED